MCYLAIVDNFNKQREGPKRTPRCQNIVYNITGFKLNNPSAEALEQIMSNWWRLLLNNCWYKRFEIKFAIFLLLIYCCVQLKPLAAPTPPAITSRVPSCQLHWWLVAGVFLMRQLWNFIQLLLGKYITHYLCRYFNAYGNFPCTFRIFWILDYI